jgi:hypothetical protein
MTKKKRPAPEEEADGRPEPDGHQAMEAKARKRARKEAKRLKKLLQQQQQQQQQQAEAAAGRAEEKVGLCGVTQRGYSGDARDDLSTLPPQEDADDDVVTTEKDKKKKKKAKKREAEAEAEAMEAPTVNGHGDGAAAEEAGAEEGGKKKKKSKKGKKSKNGDAEGQATATSGARLSGEDGAVCICGIARLVGARSHGSARACVCVCGVPLNPIEEAIQSFWEENQMVVSGSRCDQYAPVLEFRHTSFPQDILQCTSGFSKPTPIQSQVGQE